MKQDEVYLKRKPKEVKINGYNNTVMRSWHANQNIQFILDPYACVKYSERQKGCQIYFVMFVKKLEKMILTNANKDVELETSF